MNSGIALYRCYWMFCKHRPYSPDTFLIAVMGEFRPACYRTGLMIRPGT